MHWERGRQGTGYWKLRLGQGSWWDCYLLDYPAGTAIPTHTDPVPGKRHWRLNVVVAGEQAFEGDSVFRCGCLVLFRPDVMAHAVRVVERRRLVLSVGWVTGDGARTSPASS